MKPKSKLSVSEELFDDLPYEVIWLDESGKIVYANKKLLEKLDYNKLEIIKLSIFDINPTVNIKMWDEHWQLIEDKGSAVFQTTHMGKNGKLYDVEIFSAYFLNNGKKLTWGIISDITDFSFRKNLMGSTEQVANVGGWELNVLDGTLVITN